MNYIYNINDIIEVNTGKIKILKRTIRNNVKAYEYICLNENCNFKHESTEYHIKDGRGCPCCSGYKCVTGINDIATTNKELIKYFKDKDLTKKISKGSGRKEIMVCPNCGHEKNMSVYNLYKKGFSCPKCGDGKPYPEKFFFNFLEQLFENSFINNFEVQKKFDWSENKIYDFYITSLNIIIEINGEQHYKKTFSTIAKTAKTLEEEQENDRLKEELALANGIEHYIVLDCRKSELEWIKNSVLNSELNNIFDLSNIDWNKCSEFALSSLMTKVCDLWNDGKTVKEIQEKFKLDGGTVRKYLKINSEIGKCNYDAISERNKGLSIGRKNKRKSIVLCNTGEIFESVKAAEKAYNVSNENISKCLKKKTKYAGKHPITEEKLIWKYLD